MQLKIRRSQRTAGVVSNSAVFMLDARAEYTPEERANINRYKLGPQLVWSNARAREKIEAAKASARSGKHWKSAALLLAGRVLHTNITIDDLGRGQHIECKDLAELKEAGEALLEACQSLQQYLTLAATFDGREVMFGFDKMGEVQVVEPGQTASYPMEPPSPTPTGETASPDPPPFNAGPQPATPPATFIREYRRADGSSHFHAERNILAEVRDFIRGESAVVRIALIGGVSVILLYVVLHVL